MKKRKPQNRNSALYNYVKGVALAALVPVVVLAVLTVLITIVGLGAKIAIYVFAQLGLA